MNPPPQDDIPIITQFKSVDGQWELTEDNINRIDPDSGETILHNYCQYINSTPITVFEYLIETKGSDAIRTKDNSNNTPLHYAIQCSRGGDIAVLYYLLNQKNVDVNIKGESDRTLLHFACKAINTLPLDIYKLLIETHGADVNAQDNCNNTPIHDALYPFDPNYGGDAAVLMYLLNQKNVNAKIKNESDRTLLHLACQFINRLPLDIYMVLIETHGADINTRDNCNDTPIRDACNYFNPNYGGDIAVLTYLLNQKGQTGYSLLHFACKNINTFPLDHKACINLISCAWDGHTTRQGFNQDEEEAKVDLFWASIMEIVVENCIKQVVNETTL